MNALFAMLTTVLITPIGKQRTACDTFLDAPHLLINL